MVQSTYSTLFGFLIIACIITVFNSISRRLSKKDKSSIYIAQSFIIFFLLFNDFLSSATLYGIKKNCLDHIKIQKQLTYFIVLFFVYIGTLISIAPNQKALNITIPSLGSEHRKRIFFWTCFTLLTLIYFFWNVDINEFVIQMTVVLVFTILGFLGLLIEFLNSRNESENTGSKVSEKLSAGYTYISLIACLLFVCWLQIYYAHNR